MGELPVKNPFLPPFSAGHGRFGAIRRRWQDKVPLLHLSRFFRRLAGYQKFKAGKACSSRRRGQRAYPHLSRPHLRWVI